MPPDRKERGRPGKATSTSDTAGDGHPQSTRSLIEAAHIAAAARGCLCAPHVEISNVVGFDRIHRAIVRHDDWCPVLTGDAE